MRGYNRDICAWSNISSHGKGFEEVLRYVRIESDQKFSSVWFLPFNHFAYTHLEFYIKTNANVLGNCSTKLIHLTEKYDFYTFSRTMQKNFFNSIVNKLAPWWFIIRRIMCSAHLHSTWCMGNVFKMKQFCSVYVVYVGLCLFKSMLYNCYSPGTQ